MLDGTYDGGGDDYYDYPGEEIDHGDGDGDGQDYPQQEEYENDADNFESHQLHLDNEADCGNDYD